MANYKILAVGKQREVQTNNGTFKVYDIELEGEGWAEVMQKPDSPAPKPGDSLEGTVTNDPKWGKKFKRQGAGGAPAGRQNDPETRGSIERQTALKEAREAVYNFHLTKSDAPQDLDTYVVEIIATAKKFQGHLGNSNPQTTVRMDDNLPPASNYENMQ